MPETLMPAERDRLARFERIIQRGIAAFKEVGSALAAIRDQELHRGTHATFEAYCEEKWGLTRSRAYQLMESAEAVSTIVDTGLPEPGNEAQARQLARMPEDQRAEVWEETNERTEGKPTAKAIRETWQEREQAEERSEGGRGVPTETATPKTEREEWPPTKREREKAERREQVQTLLNEGLSYRQIGEELGITKSQARSAVTANKPNEQSHSVMPNRASRPIQKSQHQTIPAGLSSLRGLCSGIDDITQLEDSITADQAAEWLRDLETSLRVLRRFRDRLKERSKQ